MADRPLNPAFQRAPLQESRTHNINQPREYHRINALNIHSGLYNKPGQDVGIARSTTSVKMPLKPNMPAPQSDKDNTRTRIALQQKPLNGNNSSNVRAPLGSSRTLPNSVYKLKPVPFPGFTSTTPSYTRSDATLEKPNPDRPQAQPHQPDQVQHPLQPWDTQSQSQPQLSGPEWGSREWKQKMEEKLARCCFFFDSVDPAVANKITSVARKYGGRRTQFFSKDATHVITTRPVPGGSVLKRIRNKGDSGQSLAIQQDPKRMTTKPLAPPLAPNAETNILVKALELGMKIWTLDEALKLLSHVDPRLGKRNDNHKLEDMLQYEKVHGVATAHIDNSTKPDFHVFQGKYVLVDDATGFYRTIMAYDFTATPSETGKQPWPKIYIQDTDRSPFCYIEPAVKESERPPEARDDKGEDAKADKDCGDAPQEAQPMENEKISPSAMASGIVNSVTSNIVSTSTSAATKPLAATNLQQDRRVEQLEKRALNATKAETGISVDSFKRPEFAHPLDIVRPDTTNTASGHAARNVDPDRETTKDARHTMQPPNQPLKQEPGHTMPTNNDHLVAQLDTLDPERNKATDAAPALPAPADMHIGVGLNPSHKEAKDYRKKGYCENCRGFFDNFEKHVESAAHQKYANNAAKFAQLDVLLAKLQRRPRVASALSEPPRSATTIPESESSDSPSVTAPCSDKPATLAPEPADKEYIQDAVDLALQDHQNPGLPLGMPVDATQPAQDQAQSQGEPMWEAQDAQEAHEDREAHEDQEPFDGALSQTRRDDEEDEGIVEDMDDEAPVEDFEDQGALTLQPTGGVADPDDLADQLSSELSQMGLAERGVDVHCDQSVEPVNIQKQEETPVESLEAVKAPTTSSLQKVLRHEFRLPASDRGGPSEGNLTSQITTDTTQPDDRFLGSLRKVLRYQEILVGPISLLGACTSLTLKDRMIQSP
ncbi:hypothetical protein BGX23_004367 [Mortierella sp. AD031]|nr:hypothetical protein BGX23_004367 [Mortierella sp. AD031]